MPVGTLFAHVGGLPVEETAAALLPAAVMFGLGMRVAAHRVRRGFAASGFRRRTRSRTREE